MNSFFALFYVVTVLAYVFSANNSAYELPRVVLYTLAPLLAFVCSVLAVRAFGPRSVHGRSLILIGLGLLAWFLGEALWSYHDFVLHVDPFPSAADGFYLLAYPLLLAGLINEVRASHIAWCKVGKAECVFLVLVSLVLCLLVGYFEIYAAYSLDVSWLENFFHIAYGVGDLILIVASLLMASLVWEFRGGKLFKPWIFFFCGLVLVLLADILFANFNTVYTNKVWPYFQLIDLTWILSYVLFGLSFFKAREVVIEQQKKVLNQLRAKT